MGKRIIKLGKWNNKELEWEVFDEDEFQMLVICRSSVGKMHFGSNYCSWRDSEIRKFLNTKFMQEAFTTEERKKIVNTKLSDEGNTKDDIFILSKDGINHFLDFKDSYGVGKGCDACTWTRTRYDNYGRVYVGFAHCSSRLCSTSLSNNYHVRPVMYLKKN